MAITRALLLSVALLLAAPETSHATCVVGIELTEGSDLGALDLTLDYEAAAGSFAIQPGKFDPECTSPLADTVVEFADDRPNRVVSVGFLSFAGFSAPQTLALCTFNAAAKVSPEDFIALIGDATNTGGEEALPAPEIRIDTVGCDPDAPTTTTTSSSTTTTASVTSSTMAGAVCTLEFSLLEDVSPAALQWKVDYDPALGGFPGSGADVACEILVSGTLTALNDDDAGVFEVGHISFVPFSTDGPLLRCDWVGPSPPSGGDFAVTLVVATDGSSEDIEPPPTVALTRLDCSGGVTTTTIPFCGDGVVQAGEACDDANNEQADGCLNDCVSASCGDAIIWEGEEECDDANTLHGDGCSAACALDTFCGDADASGRILASDALLILRFAVGFDVICPNYLCNIDGDDKVLASDALAALRLAVFLETTTTCPRPRELLLELAAESEVSRLLIEWFDINNAGSFDGLPESPECSLLVDGSMAQSPLVDGVELDLNFAEELQADQVLLRCAFTTRDVFDPTDFAVDVVEALDAEGLALLEEPLFTIRAN